MKALIPALLAAMVFGHCSPKTAPVGSSVDVSSCSDCIVLTEQAQNRIVLLDLSTKQFVWEWKAAESNVKQEHVKWFNTPSDAKPVYDRKYVLITASGGGVALIRLADNKAVFYANAGGNPHSAELLPDGNIVSASSTENYLSLFRTDTTVAADQVQQKRMFIEFGHNVVWDKERGLLWSAAMNTLKAFRYNNNCNDPELKIVDSISLPGTEAHDLFPVFGKNMLWVTNTTQVYTFDVLKKELTLQTGLGAHVKSISSGPAGVPTITTRPKEKWWTDELYDTNGKSIYRQEGLRIYKARWWLPNAFSYPDKDVIRMCPLQ